MRDLTNPFVSSLGTICIPILFHVTRGVVKLQNQPIHGLGMSKLTAVSRRSLQTPYLASNNISNAIIAIKMALRMAAKHGSSDTCVAVMAN